MSEDNPYASMPLAWLIVGVVQRVRHGGTPTGSSAATFLAHPRHSVAVLLS